MPPPPARANWPGISRAEVVAQDNAVTALVARSSGLAGKTTVARLTAAEVADPVNVVELDAASLNMSELGAVVGG